MGRAYHRREYYFFQDTGNDLNPVNCIRSLPDMTQFGEYNMNYNPGFQFRKERASVETGFLSILLEALLNGKDGRLYCKNDNEDVLKSVNTLPGIYLNNVQIGLNFSASNPFESQLQIVTSETASNTSNANPEIVKLAEDIIHDASWYDDRELVARKETDMVQALAKYHQLAFYLKNQQITGNREKVIADLQEYLTNFYKQEYIQRDKIQDRVKKAWKLLSKESMHDQSLFYFAWDLVINSGIKEVNLPGFTELNEQLIPIVAAEMGSIEEIENKFVKLGAVKLNGTGEPVTSQIVTQYIETRPLASNDMKLLLDLVEKGRTINKKAIAAKIDHTLLRSLGDDGQRILNVFGSELPLTTMEPLVKSMGTSSMYAYAHSNKGFFSNKKLVTACEDFMHLKELSDDGIKQSLDWAALYKNNDQQLRIERSDAEKTLIHAGIQDWNRFVTNMALAASIFPKLDESLILKSQLVKNLDSVHLPLFLSEYVKNKNSRLTLGEDVLFAKNLTEFRDNYRRIKNHKDLFKQGSLVRYARMFIEEFDFIKNKEAAVEYIQLVEADNYSILEENSEIFKDVLTGAGQITPEVARSSRFINTVILGNPEEKSRKKKDSAIMSGITRYGAWVLAAGFAAALIYYIISNSQQKMQLQEQDTQLKIKNAQIDSLKVQRKPVDQIFIRSGKKDTLASYKLFKVDSLIYKLDTVQ